MWTLTARTCNWPIRSHANGLPQGSPNLRVKPGKKEELEISNSTRIGAYSRLWRAQPETIKSDCEHGVQRLLCRTVHRPDRKQPRFDGRGGLD